MKAPVYEYGLDFGGIYANNNFAISYDGRSYGESNTVSDALLLNIPVKKIWNGGLSLQRDVEVQLVSRVKGSGDEFQPAINIDGEEQIVTLNASNLNDNGEWIGLFEDNPVVNALGEYYEYSLVEVTELENFVDVVSGATRTGFVVDNTYTLPKHDITVTTEWLNGENITKPGTTVTLMVKNSVGNFVPVLDQDGNPVTATVDENGNATFTEVEVTDNDGNPLTFTVVQEGLEGSDWTNQSITEITPANITDGVVTVDEAKTNIHIVNEYVPPVGDIEATKTYVGGKAPYPVVYFQLYRRLVTEAVGTEVKVEGLEPTIVYGSTYPTTVSFVDQPLTDITGIGYVYSVKEVNELGEDYVPVNYVKTGEGTLNITNEYFSPKTEHTVQKVWVNGPDIKPDLTLTLKRRTGTVEDTTFSLDFTLTEANQGNLLADEDGREVWSHTFTNLDLTDKNANEYTYYVVENTVPEGYNLNSTVRQEVEEEVQTIITNEFIVEVGDVKVTKEWDGGNPNIHTIALELTRSLDGVTFEKVEQVTLNGKDDVDGDGNVWTYTFKDLPLTNLKGETYTYKVNETIVPTNFTPVLSEDGLTITNIYTSPKVEKQVTKQWVDGPEVKPEITLVLYRQVEGGQKEEVERITLDTSYQTIKDGNLTIWSHTFIDLDLTDREENVYTYTVEELQVPANYEIVAQENDLLVINRYVPRTADLTADVEWINGENVSKPEVELTLKYKVVVDGVDRWIDALDSQGNPVVGVLNEDGTWSFADVVLEDKQGNPLEFTVLQEGLDETPWVNNEITVIKPLNEEGTVDESQTNVHVVNEYVVPTTDLTVTTEWLNGEEVVKPGTVVTLMVKDTEGNFVPVLDQDGNPVTTTVDENGNATFTDVEVTDKDGNPLTFTVLQEGLEGSDWTNQSITEITPATNVDGVVTVDPEKTNVHVVNEYVVPTTDLTVTTEWLNGEDVVKPGTVVTLMVKDTDGNFVPVLDQDGNPVTTPVDENGNATFTDVEVTDKDGNPLTFTVVQEGLEGSDWTNQSITEITPATNVDGVVTVDPEKTNVHIVNEYVVVPVDPEQPVDPERPEVPETPGEPEQPKPTPTPTPEKPETPKNPNTSDDMNIALFAGAIIISGAVLVFLNKKKTVVDENK